MENIIIAIVIIVGAPLLLAGIAGAIILFAKLAMYLHKLEYGGQRKDDDNDYSSGLE